MRLRPLREGDLELLERFEVDPSALGELAWTGFADPTTRRRRWEEHGLVSEDRTDLAVDLPDGTLTGVVQAFRLDPRLAPGTLEIGCGLFPEHRGQGIGTAAQRALVAEIFASRPVHRLEAGTDVENVAEQRALESIGFVREGVLRQADFQRGRWRDVALYGLLRGEERI